ncbi:MAG: hypothetical protein ACK42L_11305, partial [Thermoanaerobaculum sp.]
MGEVAGKVLVLERLFPFSTRDVVGPSEGAGVAKVPPESVNVSELTSHSRKGVLVVLVNGLCDRRTKIHLLQRLRMETAKFSVLAPIGEAVAGDGHRWVGEAHLPAEFEELIAQLETLETVNWQLKLRRERQFGFDGENAFALAAAASGEEQVRLRRVLESLRETVIRRASSRRAVFLLWDGFDIDAGGYYRPNLVGFARGQAGSGPNTPDVALGSQWEASLFDALVSLGSDLSSLGVPVITFNPGYMAAYSPAWSAQFRRPVVSPEVF